MELVSLRLKLIRYVPIESKSYVPRGRHHYQLSDSFFPFLVENACLEVLTRIDKAKALVSIT
jgi:hypothetical protein